MKRAHSYFMIVAAILLLASCSSLQQYTQLKPLSGGETRLTGIEMPEYVREDLSYDVILRFDSDETPQINRVCFRWTTEEISSSSPSLYCYSMNGDFGSGAPCADWAYAGGMGSSPFCSEGSEVKTDVPGRLIVRIHPTNLNIGYNRLVGQIEYVSNGQVRMSNSVKTPVIVEK